MSLGMSAAWRGMQPKQKRCERCELYTPKKLNECIHCSALSDAQLVQLKAHHQETLESNSNLGKYFLAGAIAIGILLLLSFL